MKWYFILLIVIGSLLILGLLISYICFRIVFYQDRNKNKPTEEFELPPGDIYIEHKEIMFKWMKEARNIIYEKVQITSFDNLKLVGKYYECGKDNIIEIMFHGYRGKAERDLCGGIQRAFALNHNVLIVDQRTSGESEGNVISFGINERKDCLSWIDFINKKFNNPCIILCGISMGAATVLMASNMNLPNNVIGILADCSYSSQKEIIMKCTKDLHLPPKLFYPFIKFGAKLFGHFNLEETSPIQAIKDSNIPIILFHGTTDDFVPCYMSEKLYAEKPENAKLVTIPNAGHGLCYLIDSELYIKSLKEFFL